MINHLAVILAFQLLGEVLTRSLDLIIPGPVLGMVLIVLAFMVFPKIAATIRPTALGLLAYLSLLFVPAGVGVVGHVAALGSDGWAILAALVGSSVLAITTGALVFVGLSKLMGQADD